ncbi:hypothetical protein AAD018_006805 [Aestuariibius insulae]
MEDEIVGAGRFEKAVRLAPHMMLLRSGRAGLQGDAVPLKIP